MSLSNTYPSLEDLPLEIIYQISHELPLPDRSRLMKVSSKCWHGAGLWADITKAQIYATIELYAGDTKVFLRWNCHPTQFGILNRFLSLRELHLGMDCSPLTVDHLTRLHHLHTLVLYNQFFSCSEQLMSSSVLLHLLSLPSLRHLVIKRLLLESLSSSASCILTEYHVNHIQPALTSLHITGIQVSRQVLHSLAEHLLLLEDLSVEAISDMKTDYQGFMKSIGRFRNLQTIEVPRQMSDCMFTSELLDSDLTMWKPISVDNNIKGIKLNGVNVSNQIRYFLYTLPISVQFVFLGDQKIYIPNSIWSSLLTNLSRPLPLVVVLHRLLFPNPFTLSGPNNLVASPHLFWTSLPDAIRLIQKGMMDSDSVFNLNGMLSHRERLDARA